MRLLVAISVVSLIVSVATLALVLVMFMDERWESANKEAIKIVDYNPQQDGKVFFGAWVEIEDEEGEVLSFRIVGTDEIYGRNDYISIDAPMARALLKKEVDDEAVVRTPHGEKVWLVNAIRYQQD